MSPLSREAFLWNKAQAQGKMNFFLLVMLSKQSSEGLSKDLMNFEWMKVKSKVFHKTKTC